MTANHIDYVIVLQKNKLTSNYASCLLEFIRSLQVSGIECDLKQGNIKKNYYVTIFVPQKAMSHFANIYNIDIDNSGHLYIPYTQKFPHLFETPYSDSNWSYQRQQDGISKMERILITTAILNDAKFGTDEALSGLDNLVRLKAVKTAFPLHDGPLRHDRSTKDEAELNDRELLEKHWGSFGCWYKEQPLNLIQKYYGCEVAFYFAWLGFYIKMLVPAAIVGVICFMIGLIRLLTSDHHQINDICLSNMTICPICHANDHCVFQKLSYYCIYAKLSFLFDNPATVAFAVIMSFWATVFLNRWRSYEAVLKLRWNVDLIDTDTKMRLEYRLKAKRQRLSPISGELEPYISPLLNYFYIVLTYATCVLLILIVIGAVCGVILYRITMASLTRLNDMSSEDNNISFWTLISSAVIQVVFIKIFSLFYSPLSIWLTKLENPRTQSEFDYSVVYKRFFLAFANNYSSLFYIAFLKGSFYTPQHEPTLVSFETDICSPSGCVVPLCIQLGFLMVLKSLIGNVLILMKPYFWMLVNYCRERKKREKGENEGKSDSLVKLQFEEEYKLHANEKYELVNEYMEMIIQYGFVTFFVASFPLAPLCALINNAIELRLDAIKFTKRNRRVVPRQSSGIGPWNGILSALTHLSIATNAFVIAFTSDFVIRQLYKINNHGSLVGYLDSILSVFDMSHHYITSVENATMTNLDDASVCHYRANRYPPGHPNQYKLTTYFWYEIGIRLLAVIIFEHAVVFLNGILSFVLPKMPHSVKQFLNYKRALDKDIKLNLVKENELKMKVVRRTESNTNLQPSKLTMK